MTDKKAFLKQVAAELGFEECGVAKAQFLEPEARLLENWLSKGYNGQMGYMANHFDKRLDPRLLMPGAQSVISLSYNYFPEQTQHDDSPKISKYAYGSDYHEVIKSKLKALVFRLQESWGNFEVKLCVDSVPILEKAWAQRAGLGWIGKHANLIQKKRGSFFFLAEIIIDLALEPDQAFSTDHCGNCTRCIDACPTEAIISPSLIDGSKCISYFTIELKGEIPKTMGSQFQNWVFGCDVCQDVCPWNRFSAPQNKEELKPLPEILEWRHNDWQALQEETFKKVFGHSPMKRSKYDGIKRNLTFFKSNASLSDG